MERQAGGLREGLEPLLEELGIHLAELGLGELDLPYQVGPVRGIERDAAQRLVHRDRRFAKAPNALAIAERLGDGLAERDPRILGRVVIVDVQVALRRQRDVDKRMARKLLDHVIEKADAGRDLVASGAVEVDARRNAGLLGLAFDARLAHGALYSRKAEVGLAPGGRAPAHGSAKPEARNLASPAGDSRNST